MKVLVTGYAGLLGREIVRRLEAGESNAAASSGRILTSRTLPRSRTGSAGTGRT
jgi:hypothetical protein